MLSSLTVRGRALLAGGVVSVVASPLAGQPLLLAGGLLVLVLVALSLAVSGRRADDTTVSRVLSSGVVQAGSPVVVRAQLGADTAAALQWEEQLPWSLGPRPRVVTTGREWHHFDYRVAPPTRGRFPLGPMEVRRGDPFGLVERRWSAGGETPLLVTPATVTLPVLGLGGAMSASGEQRPRAFASGSAEDVTVRDYRRGDDLRRVHWRSTARVGELMVRREEQPWQARATVFLDNRAGAHRGPGPASSFEAAVSAAASICAHLVGLGFTVRLVSAAQVVVPAATVSSPLLEALAEIETTPARVVDPRVFAEQTALTVGVVGGTGPEGLEPLRRARVQSGMALAVVVSSGQWGPEPPSHTAEAAALIRHAGWRTVEFGRADALAEVWAMLGVAGRA
ncbi:DUF58 domain-containing protein [Nocardioides sp. Kera G14]|uniref:DUF58 domain-containing protein n=1 Tax=Nocardioides sp. Kera G14 TaxID=2884264 RepID=UPI001D10EDBC|nr:DUF58 domain-containing protein [Nocardioides sp. Kera G14]UDY22497.1 DUF58 domain-containing protein [Nocardioides sp. Kera G14]